LAGRDESLNELPLFEDADIVLGHIPFGRLEMLLVVAPAPLLTAIKNIL
jgi:hypothetical protein